MPGGDARSAAEARRPRPTGGVVAARLGGAPRGPADEVDGWILPRSGSRSRRRVFGERRRCMV